MGDSALVLESETSGSQTDGELVVVRVGAWRMLIPLRYVGRVYEAVLPAALPGGAHPVVSVRGRMLPLLFCSSLLGAERAVLSPSDKMVLLQDAERSALLHVHAVEDVLPFDPVDVEAKAPVAPQLIAGFAGVPEPLAILDVPYLLQHAST